MSRIRKLKEHLHHGNYVKTEKQENMVYLEKRADIDCSLSINFKLLNEDQLHTGVQDKL